MKKPKAMPKEQQKVLKELMLATNAINHAWELICKLDAKCNRQDKIEREEKK